MSQAEKATDNLEKKYKRLRKNTSDLINKNTIYQNDVYKSEKRIEAMEVRFNHLVEDFQKYINQKEQEIAKKDQTIFEYRNKPQDSLGDDNYNPITVDPEERRMAMGIYQEIVDDYKIPQERDEVMLDTIEKYIDDKKQPNLAFSIWEAADFTHCNNIEKSYKLMRALLQDCYIPIKKPDSEFDDRNSFSFRETQLKQSYENEKKLIDKQCEKLLSDLDKKTHEILELKDIIRLKTQEFELLKQTMKDADMGEVRSNKSRKDHAPGISNYNDSENGSISKSRSQSPLRSADQPIQPYGEHRKDVDELQKLVYDLRQENQYLIGKLGRSNSATPKNTHAHARTGEGDGTVEIGGMSHMGLNTTDEHNNSIKNIDMSPIETRDKDVSAADEGLMRVFDRSVSNNDHVSSKRKLEFNQQEYERQNLSSSAPELDNLKSNRDDLYYNGNEEINYLKQVLDDKQHQIDELTKRIQFYTKNVDSKDYSSPRFMEPEYLRNERSRNQKLTAEKVFQNILNIYDDANMLYDMVLEKFSNFIESSVRDNLYFEQLSQNESKQIENFKKDDDLQLLQTLNSISGLTTKTSNNINNVCKLIQTAKESNSRSDSLVQNEERMLHVKSDHQLFLIKDLTQEVSKIFDQANDIKSQFPKMNKSVRGGMRESNRDLSDFEYSPMASTNPHLNKATDLMEEMDG